MTKRTQCPLARAQARIRYRIEPALNRWQIKGSSLIEVMLAVAVISVTALGFIATQVWSTRQALVSGYREEAVWIADALVEIARSPFVSGGATNAAMNQWQARASSQLPRGEATLQPAVSTATGVARVMWSEPLDRTLQWSEVMETCGALITARGTACVTLAFAP